MNELNGQHPIKPKAVMLSSRQLTIIIDPTHHAMLNDLAQYNGVTVHAAATEYLSQAIVAAYQQLRVAKFLFIVSTTWR